MTESDEWERYKEAIHDFAMKQMTGECDRWRGIEYWEKVLPAMFEANPKLAAHMLATALDRKLCDIRKTAHNF